MTDFTDQLERDNTQVYFTDFARPVTIGGSDLVALIDDTFDDDDPRAPMLRLPLSDVPNIAAGDAVTIGADTYKVEVVLPEREGLVTLKLSAVL